MVIQLLLARAAANKRSGRTEEQAFGWSSLVVPSDWLTAKAKLEN